MKSVQRAAKLLRKVAEDLNERWFVVTSLNPKRKFTSARRLPDGKILLAVGGGREIAVAYSKEDAAKIVSTVRDAKDRVVYEPETRQEYLNRYLKRYVDKPPTEDSIPRKERWFRVERNKANKSYNYSYAKRVHGGEGLWLWDGGYSTHRVTMEEAEKRVTITRVNGKLPYVPLEDHLYLEDSFQHYLHR